MTDTMDTMPQTVPSFGLPSSVFDYSATFADFDLSLLPTADSEVPCSPQSEQQLLSLYCDTTSPPPMFPSPTGEDFYKQKDDYFLKIKEEPFPSTIDFATQSWESSPTSSTYSSPLYYPSPPRDPFSDSLSNIKQEVTIDLEEIIKESKYLQDIYCPTQPKKNSIIRNILEKKQEKKPDSDHRLLREVLKDTSFQRKYNLKPFDIGGLGTAFKTDIKMEAEESGKGEGTSQVAGAGAGLSSGAEGAVCGVDIAQERIEPMLSLAIEQLKEDLSKTCTVLGIAMDPAQWSAEDVKSWLVYNLQQFSLPMAVVEHFPMPGNMLVQLTEEEFQQRAPQCGYLLHAQLEIWKAACVQGSGAGVDVSGLLETATQSSSSCGDASEDEEDDDIAYSPHTSSPAPQAKGRGGSHIHLWQFLKELLSNPQANGACIRWLDRTNGVFKIEDSVRVARLWGKRKNRPAMNYDKLSRSIRQYYKKGIMKKTERSQRLVYQFCHPYCL